MLNSCGRGYVRACVSACEWVCVCVLANLRAQVSIVQIIQRISSQYTNKMLECEHDNLNIGI